MFDDYVLELMLGWLIAYTVWFGLIERRVG